MDDLIENVPRALPMYPSTSPLFAEVEPLLGKDWLQLKLFIQSNARAADTKTASNVLLLLDRIIARVLDPVTIQQVYGTMFAVPMLLRGMRPIISRLLVVLGPNLINDPLALEQVRGSLEAIKRWNVDWKDYEAKSRACDSYALRFTSNPWRIFMNNNVTPASRKAAKKALPRGSQLLSVELVLPQGASRIISRWLSDTREVVREVEQAVGEKATIGRETAHFTEVGWVGGRIGDDYSWTVNPQFAPMPMLNLGATPGFGPMLRTQLAEELAIKMGHKVTSPNPRLANVLRYRVSMSEAGLQGPYRGVQWQATDL